MAISTIHEKVVEQISGSSDAVRSAVINHLANKELDRRINAIIEGLNTLKVQEAELVKLKPDQNSFNLDGSVASATYSKTALEARNKLVQKIEKLKKAIDLALDKSDYGQLFSLNQNKGNSDETT